jgi:hypothetical protein
VLEFLLSNLVIFIVIDLLWLTFCGGLILLWLTFYIVFSLLKHGT